MTAVALTAELVPIDSVNPGLVPGAAGESAIVGLPARAARTGRASPRTWSRPGRRAGPASWPSARVRTTDRRWSSTGTSTPSAWRGCPRRSRPSWTATALSGRGAADMKGGVAALVAAAEELVAVDAPVRPVLALVADEEDASLGSEAVIAALPDLGITPDVCLIGEPTDLALARSLRGFAVVRVEFAGTGGAQLATRPRGQRGHPARSPARHGVEERASGVRADGGDLMVTVARAATPRSWSPTARSAWSNGAPSPRSPPPQRWTRSAPSCHRTAAPSPSSTHTERPGPRCLRSGGRPGRRAGQGAWARPPPSTRRTGWRRHSGRRSAPR